MKKIIFVVLFSMILFCAYGQQRSENRWLIGTWTRASSFVIDGFNVNETWTFNDNGSGKWQIIATKGRERKEFVEEFIFFINENTLMIFPSTDGNNSADKIILYRINDQKMVIGEHKDRDYGYNIIYNKRN